MPSTSVLQHFSIDVDQLTLKAREKMYSPENRKMQNIFFSMVPAFREIKVYS